MSGIRVSNPTPAGRSGAVTRAAASLLAVALLATPALASGGPKSSTALSTVTPGDGQTVSGTVTWEIAATGQTPRHVSFSVDGAVVETVESEPFSVDLDTTGLSNGPHTLAAESEGSKQQRDATQISVTVANPSTAPAPAPAPTPDAQPPSLPTGFVATATTATSISTTWAAATDDVGVAGYRLWLGGAPAGDVTGTSFTFSGLSCGTTEALEVAAYDAAGNVSAHASLRAATVACAAGGDASPPTVPRGFTQTSTTTGSIRVAWVSSTDDTAVSGYDVFVDGAHAARVAAGGTTTTAVALTGLACGTAHRLTVDAFDVAGNVSKLAQTTGETRPCGSSSGAYPPPLGCGACWVPSPATTWQWQLTTPVDQTVPAQLYDIDGFDNGAAVVSSLHAKGVKAACYLDVGAYEDYRPDAKLFPASVRGAPDQGWDGEWWLDIRQLDVLGPIMAARLDMCKRKGFDGVELDEVNAYANDSGFPLTAADQLRYNVWLANETHRRGMFQFLKSDPDQSQTLLPYFDANLNEQCYQYDECDLLMPFVNAGKAVFDVEYSLTPQQFCADATRRRFMAMQKHLDLDQWRSTCGW
jgi:hypothetical protein